MTSKTRKANIELLRIVSMVMIVILHFLMHGEILKWSPFATTEYAVYWMIESFVFVSVNAFVLISGYFLCTTDFKFSRIFKLWIQVFFYSILCTIVCTILGGVPSVKTIVRAFVPLSASQYWFATAYVLMIFVSPFLNIAIKEMSKKQHLLCVYVICLLFCIMPTFFVWERDLVTKGMDYMWFIALYIIAAYIRKYGILPCLTTRVCLLGYIGCSIVTGGARIPLGYISSHLGFGYTLSGLFFRYNSILVAMASIFLFCLFLQIKITNNTWSHIILKIAPLTFAVYLIHDHPMVRHMLWSTLPMAQWFNNGISVTLIAMCISVLCIFGCSCIVEKGRLLLFEKVGIERLILFMTKKADKLIKDNI